MTTSTLHHPNSLHIAAMLVGSLLDLVGLRW